MSNRQQNKIIEKLKSNLCVFVCKDPNYDYVNYDQPSIQQQQQQQNNDNLEGILTPKLQNKSRTRLPIYYKTPTNSKQQQKQLTVTNYDSDIDVQSSISQQIPLHSTKLDDNIKSPRFQCLATTTDFENDNQRISSTLVYKILSTTKQRLKVNDDISPNVSEIPIINQQQQHGSSSSTGCSSIDSTYSSTVSSECDASSNRRLFGGIYTVGAIYACFSSYDAQYDGDLPTNFADRLQIIKDDGNDFVLVKNLSTRAFGYVPRDHILPVNEFLANLI